MALLRSLLHSHRRPFANGLTLTQTSITAPTKPLWVADNISNCLFEKGNEGRKGGRNQWPLMWLFWNLRWTQVSIRYVFVHSTEYFTRLKFKMPWSVTRTHSTVHLFHFSSILSIYCIPQHHARTLLEHAVWPWSLLNTHCTYSMSAWQKWGVGVASPALLASLHPSA